MVSTGTRTLRHVSLLSGGAEFELDERSMGLKLKKPCNLLNTLLKHNHEVFTVTLNSQAIQNKLNCKLNSKEICSDFSNIHKSMDRFSEQCNRESIKNIMLKQEEIFKQQVRELHRLYQIQKMLMTRQRCEKVKMNSFVATSNPEIVTDTMNKLQNSRTSSETTHSSHASVRNNSNAVLNSEHTLVHQSAAMAAGHASRDLINFSEPLRTSKEYLLQNPVEGESPESCSNEECNLDLTLSIGCASDKTKSADWKEMTKRSTQLLTSNLNREASEQEFTNSSNGFGAESLKRPRWLFQALSLNRT
ncbi:hypothetical protein IEQ34_011512 [Dendrobium chrysotoxum]|uniref:Uncharacterized protein n=1 Tax=Dendrobium chrysotoxum TaxID=161865 RepID=A0AAV7GSN6_DENCH|nr:hypothetical protein IEQ34_011512 [Dendrobium chrysotoxum]